MKIKTLRKKNKDIENKTTWKQSQNVLLDKEPTFTRYELVRYT